jgi:hypothetical protein
LFLGFLAIPLILAVIGATFISVRDHKAAELKTLKAREAFEAQKILKIKEALEREETSEIKETLEIEDKSEEEGLLVRLDTLRHKQQFQRYPYQSYKSRLSDLMLYQRHRSNMSSQH